MSAKKSDRPHSRPKKQRKKTSAYSLNKQRTTNQSFSRNRHKKNRVTFIHRILLESMISIILVGILLSIVSYFAFSFAKVEGYSMLPVLNNGEWVFVNKLAKPKRFKLVLHKEPKSKETSVRRVIGLPGEAIYYKNDQLYINDQEVYERFLEVEVQRAKTSKSFYTENWITEGFVPKGKYIVLGDNRPYAADSRDYGYIDEKEIVGVVEMRVMPIHQIKQF